MRVHWFPYEMFRLNILNHTTVQSYVHKGQTHHVLYIINGYGSY